MVESEFEPSSHQEQEPAPPEFVELSSDFKADMGLNGVKLFTDIGDGLATINLLPHEALALADFIESHRNSLRKYDEEKWQTNATRMLPPVAIQSAEDLRRGPEPIPEYFEDPQEPDE